MYLCATYFFDIMVGKIGVFASSFAMQSTYCRLEDVEEE